MIYSLSGYSDGTTDPAVGVAASSDITAAGAVFYVVPEPSVLGMLAAGMGVLFWRRRR